MSTTATNSSPDIFIYLGHGNEEPIPYNERPKVPPGSTVVLFTKSGKPITTDAAKDVFFAMKENPEVFNNPLENKEAIETLNSGIDIRIYPEGSPMPIMNYWPEGSMEGKDRLGRYRTFFFRSGFYRFPLLTGDLISIDYIYNTLSPKDIDKLYPGDENEELRTRIYSMALPNGNIPISEIQKIKYTTPELVAAKGPGIHYFLNCRPIANLKDKSMAFITPTVNEYKKFIQSIKSPLQTNLQSIGASLKRRNITANTRRQLLQDKKNIEEKLFNIWHEYEMQLKQLETIRNNTESIPEDKLIYFRHALAQNSYLNANHQRHEPLSNEEFNVQIRPKRNVASLHSTYKRNAVRKFNETFGNMRNRVRLTRQKSQEFQRSLLNKTRRRK